MGIQWESQVITGKFPFNFRGWDVKNIVVEARSDDGQNWRVIVGDRWHDGEQYCLESSIKAVNINTSNVIEAIEEMLPTLQEQVRHALERGTRHMWRVLEAQAGKEVDDDCVNHCHRCGQQSIDVRVNDHKYVKVLVVDGRTTATPLDLHNWLGTVYE